MLMLGNKHHTYICKIEFTMPIQGCTLSGHTLPSNTKDLRTRQSFGHELSECSTVRSGHDGGPARETLLTECNGKRRDDAHWRVWPQGELLAKASFTYASDEGQKAYYINANHDGSLCRIASVQRQFYTENHRGLHWYSMLFVLHHLRRWS